MTDIATMYAPQANSPVTTTTEAITAAQMSVSVLNGAVLPAAPTLLVLGGDTENAETILVSSISGNTVTIAQRAVEGTARAWPSGTTIARLFTAKDLRDAQSNIIALNIFKAETADVRLVGKAGGNIASFPDGREDEPVDSLICEIDPVQAGSGDPSPSNVRAIVGLSSLNLQRCGRNLLVDNLVYPASNTNNNIVATKGDDGCIILNGTKGSSALVAIYNLACPTTTSSTTQFDYKKWLPNGNYVTSISATGLPSGVNVTLQAYHYDSLAASPTLTSLGTASSDGTTKSIAITDAMPFVYFRIGVTGGSGTLSNVKVYPMIRRADDPDATWEPLISSTNIAFGRSVYGGRLNVTTGELTVTHGYIESYAGETLPGKWICDRAVYVAGTTPPTGAQVVYELATPITYQLTPVEVTTRLGENNIWADCGPVDVRYSANTELRVELEAIVEEALSTKQDVITAAGILKGDGEGGIIAAEAGVDYQVPLIPDTDYARPESIPAPSSLTPEMDGTGSAGSETAYSRADHVHPADTSRQAKITASGILKGNGSGGVSPATPDEDYVTPAFLNNYVAGSEKGANSGVATLDAYGKVTPSQASARISSISSNTTLSATHYGCVLKVTGSRTITIPTGLEVGTEIEILNYGTGVVTVKAASGVALNDTTAGSKTIETQYTSAVLKCVASNTWVIQGAIS